MRKIRRLSSKPSFTVLLDFNINLLVGFQSHVSGTTLHSFQSLVQISNVFFNLAISCSTQQQISQLSCALYQLRSTAPHGRKPRRMERWGRSAGHLHWRRARSPLASTYTCEYHATYSLKALACHMVRKHGKMISFDI